MLMAGREHPPEVAGFVIEDIVIGKGSNSQIRTAYNQKNQIVAVKIIDITNHNTRRQAAKESQILKEVGTHKNVIKFVAMHCDERYCYLFMEHASGGDLYSFAIKHGPLEENLIRTFCKQIVDSLYFCHSNNVIHHDVKLENILIASDFSLRLSDFGLAIKSNNNSEEQIQSFGGSPLYMSPEIFSHQVHNHKVDVWSLGVCVYFMVFGTYPFIASNYEDLEEKVLFEPVPFPGVKSEDLQHLLSGMLEKDPTKRFNLEEIRIHRWCLSESRYSLPFGAGSNNYRW